jgi:hypothetical protein
VKNQLESKTSKHQKSDFPQRVVFTVFVSLLLKSYFNSHAISTHTIFLWLLGQTKQVWIWWFEKKERANNEEQQYPKTTSSKGS